MDRPVSFTHLRVFGSPCAVHVPLTLRGVGAKLKDASVQGYIVSYDAGLHDRYLVWLPGGNRIVSRTSVYVNENGAYATPSLPHSVFPRHLPVSAPDFPPRRCCA